VVTAVPTGHAAPSEENEEREQQKREPGRDPLSSLTAERLGQTTPIIHVQLGG
jgi:hypothetical protein